MYKGYLFNSEGRYQAPVYLNNDEDVVWFVIRYKNIVPRIMVTNSGDDSAFEAENGQIIWPELQDNVVAQLEKRVAPLSGKTNINEHIKLYNNRIEDFKASRGKDRELYQSMIQIENDLFALAARDNVNLYSLGWKSSGVIDAELDAAYYDE